MSKCDLRIVLDRPDRAYCGGEPITGTVHVRVNEAFTSHGLFLETYWRTHGRGNTDTGAKQTQVLYRGVWQPGQTYSYPFRFPAPDGPPTYHGTYLNIDHYLKVRVDVPWAFDPKLEEEFILLPGPRLYDHRLPLLNNPPDPWQFVGRYGLLLGVVLLALGLVFVCPFGVVLIPAGCVLAALGLGITLRNWLVQHRLGTVELHWERLVAAPGASVPFRLRFVPRRSTALNGIRARLIGQERCVSGSGTNKQTHLHTFYDQTVELAREGALTARSPIRLEGAIPIPATAAYSFSSPNNAVLWTVEMRIDIPAWPDWVQKKPVLVVPQAVAVEPAGKAPAEPILVEEMPQDRRRASRPRGRAGAAGSEWQTVPEPESHPDLQGPPELAEAAPQPQAASKPPYGALGTPSVLAGAMSLLALSEQLAALPPYGRQREETARRYTETVFPCALVVKSVGRTYGQVPHERFRNGRTLVGNLEGSEHTVSLLVPAEKNAQADSLVLESTWHAACRVLKWNVIYNRLDLYEV